MADTNNLELYETSRTAESLQTQARLVQDLFEGKGLKTDTAKTQLEGYYRNFLTQHSKKAYQELTAVIGLDADKIAPIQDAETVRLDPEGKGKLINYLLERNHSWIRKFVEGTPFGNEAANKEVLKQMTSMANLFHSVKENDYEVEITGPVIMITFNSVDAYAGFADSMSAVDSLGLFYPLPLRPGDKNGEWVSSSNTFVNLISPTKGYGQEGSVHQHEMYHAVNYFRLEQLRRIAEAHPDDRSINRNVLLTEAERFRERLKSIFFDPKEFVQDLETLRDHAPAVYDYYCGLGIMGTFSRETNFALEAQNFEASFLSLQREVPAFIAGYLNPKNEQPFTQFQRDEVIKTLIMLYMPFRKVKFDELRLRGSEDAEGKLVVNEHQIDNDLQKATGESINPEQQLQQSIDMIKLYEEDKEKWLDVVSHLPSEAEKQQTKMINHYAQDRDSYIKDMQRLIDFFLNPGGKGYETIERMKVNLTQAMNAYSELAQLRDNPYQALIEISLIPLSHWVTYTKRQKEILTRNPKQV